MQAGGDILTVQKEAERPFWVDVFLDGSTTSYTAKSSRGANHAFFVQKVVLSITTHATGKNVSVTETSGAKTVFKHQDTAAGAGITDVFPADFGPHGVQMTAGKDLLVSADGSTGIVGVLHIEGYEKLSTTINTGTANTLN